MGQWWPWSGTPDLDISVNLTTADGPVFLPEVSDFCCRCQLVPRIGEQFNTGLTVLASRLVPDVDPTFGESEEVRLETHGLLEVFAVRYSLKRGVRVNVVGTRVIEALQRRGKDIRNAAVEDLEEVMVELS